MSVVFLSEYDYVKAATDAAEKIRRIDLIILALLDTAFEAAVADGKKEYWLDDGQIRTKIVRNTVADIKKSILAFEQLKSLYESRLGGRQVRLVGGHNFPGRA